MEKHFQFCPTVSHWRGNTGLGNWPNGQGFWKELPVCGFLFPSPGDDGVAVVQLLGDAKLFAAPWTAACLTCLSFTISLSLLKHMSIESVMPFNHLILCHPLLLLPSIFPSIRVFSNELALPIRWPEFWSFSCSISPSNKYSGLTSFWIDWFDLFAVQERWWRDSFNSLSRLHVILICCCWKVLDSDFSGWEELEYRAKALFGAVKIQPLAEDCFGVSGAFLGHLGNVVRISGRRSTSLKLKAIRAFCSWFVWLLHSQACLIIKLWSCHISKQPWCVDSFKQTL